ncbi:MAG: hypothetical protein HYZ53_13285 [Planctomycetes bacterium]|nr:hypothetical protein [Planctomycetota bacterium]
MGRPGWRRRWAPPLCALCTLAVLGGAWRGWRAWRGGAVGPVGTTLVAAELPADCRLSAVLNFRTQLFPGHLRMVHGIGGAMEAACRADVVVAGDSLAIASVRSAALARGLEDGGAAPLVFNAALEGTTWRALLDLLERHRLAPPCLLLGLHPGYLGDSPEWYRRLAALDAYEARKLYVEAVGATALGVALDRWLPRPGLRPTLVYRSEKDGDGAFVGAASTAARVPIVPLANLERAPTDEQHAAFATLVRLCERRGIRLVAFVPPSPYGSAAFVEALARESPCAVIALDPAAGWTTRDGMHVAVEEAERYTEALARELARLLPRPFPPPGRPGAAGRAGPSGK